MLDSMKLQVKTMLGKPTPGVNFEFQGFIIPEELALKTGGGGDTFKCISDQHLNILSQVTPISEKFNVLELGCGIGRDAIPIGTLLSKKGSYIGIDVDAPSIKWCKRNIGRRFRNFKFFHFDLYNAWYNPAGKYKTHECRLPAADGSIDLIILQSVFTHLNKEDISFYLKEFSRVLKPGGHVYSSFFFLDENVLERLHSSPNPYLSFKFKLDNDCWIQDRENPTIAYGYRPDWVIGRAKEYSLKLAKGPHFGSWSGIKPTFNPDPGQDFIVFQRQ